VFPCERMPTTTTGAPCCPGSAPSSGVKHSTTMVYYAAGTSELTENPTISCRVLGTPRGMMTCKLDDGEAVHRTGTRRGCSFGRYRSPRGNNAVDGAEGMAQSSLAVHEDVGSLVSAARRRDAAAFEMLVEPHRKMILLRALRITRNHEDAEDVVQQAFQKALAHMRQFEGRSSFSTWLTRIALNEALMLKRRARRSKEVLIDDSNLADETAATTQIADTRPSPEDSCSLREQQRLLFAAMRDLNAPMRAVVQACDLDELSTAETAQLLGVSVSAVKSRLSRGRKMLRGKLMRRVAGSSQAHGNQAGFTA